MYLRIVRNTVTTCTVCISDDMLHLAPIFVNAAEPQ